MPTQIEPLIAPRGGLRYDLPADLIASTAKDEYFEIRVYTGTPAIYWKSFGTLSEPIDQD